MDCNRTYFTLTGKMDMNEAASHPGQEVFVGPHSFEAEFGPISEVRSRSSFNIFQHFFLNENFWCVFSIIPCCL